MGIFSQLFNPGSQFAGDPEFTKEVQRITKLKNICHRMWGGGHTVHIDVSDGWKLNNRTEDCDDFLKPYHPYIYLHVYLNNFYAKHYVSAYLDAFNTRNNANRYLIGETAYAKLEKNLKDAEAQATKILFGTTADRVTFQKLTYTEQDFDEIMACFSPYDQAHPDDYVFHFPVFLGGKIFTDKQKGFQAREYLAKQFADR